MAFAGSTAIVMEFAVEGTDLDFKGDRKVTIQAVEVASRAIGLAADRHFVIRKGTAVSIRGFGVQIVATAGERREIAIRDRQA